MTRIVSKTGVVQMNNCEIEVCPDSTKVSNRALLAVTFSLQKDGPVFHGPLTLAGPVVRVN